MENRLRRAASCVLILLTVPLCYLLFLKLGGRYTCLVRAITGWYCAGCGGTHMVFAICRGEFYQAFRYNPFLFITGLPLVALTVWQLYKYVRCGLFSTMYTCSVVVWLILSNIFCVVRNIGPMRWMLPTKL